MTSVRPEIAQKIRIRGNNQVSNYLEKMYYSKLYERQSTKRRTLTVQTFVKVTTHGLYILGKVSVLLFERGKKKFLGRTTEVYIRELGRII